MLFNSPVFLFLFLPITIIVYHFIPKKLKNLFLLLASVAFYAWGEKELVVLIILSALIDYNAGLLIASGKRKLGLWISLAFNLGILIYFKYFSFVAQNIYSALKYFNGNQDYPGYLQTIVLPLGISFYTFQTLSYTIDVYRGKVEANKNFVDFAMYVTFFPQLIAGPIVRYKEISQELQDRFITKTQFAVGIERFIIGLAKKMIIANNCAFIADGMFSLPSNELSTPMAWLGAVAYSFQIYFDFSGYSDMAIGLGKMFGFNFPENFNFPYAARSIREFWKKWHITLSNWFKDYLYISMGGNRHGEYRTFFNLLIVFLLTGLWHGANWTFIVWGLFHGLFMIIERIGIKKHLELMPKLLSHIYVLMILLISWVIFRSESLSQAWGFVGSMFSFNFDSNNDYLKFFVTIEGIMSIFLAIVFSIPKLGLAISSIFRDSEQMEEVSWVKIISKYSLLLILFSISIFYIATDSYNPFIYFRF